MEDPGFDYNEASNPIKDLGCLLPGLAGLFSKTSR